MLASLLLFLVSHITFMCLPSDAGALVLVPLIFMGLFYATYAAVFWPCIPLVVDKKVVGTAYGVVNSIQNIFLAICPLIFGIIHDHTKGKDSGYYWTEIFIMMMILIGLFSTLLLNYIDIYRGKIINSKPKVKG